MIIIMTLVIAREMAVPSVRLGKEAPKQKSKEFRSDSGYICQFKDGERKKDYWAWKQEVTQILEKSFKPKVWSNFHSL